MNKEDILKILEGAKDKNGDVPMRLVRQAFEKLPEPCTDTISRQAAIDALGEEPYVWTDSDSEVAEREQWRRDADAIKYLPSVTPKHKPWKWIEYDSDEDKYDVIKCPCCKHTFTVDAYHWTDIGFVKDDFKFCPNCGVDCRGKQDE